jgi:hypothetical protein
MSGVLHFTEEQTVRESFPKRFHTAELAEEADFFAWAAERWPANRFTVQLAPWQLSPSRDEP